MVNDNRGGMMTLSSKVFLGLLGLFLAVIMLPSGLAANGLVIDDVDFDDPYHAGDTVVVIVTLMNDNSLRDVEDITIKVWLEDYKGDRVTDKVEYEVVRVQENDDEDVYLTLPLPKDVLPGIYSLRATASGEVQDVGTSASDAMVVDFEIEQEEHSVEVLDVVAPNKLASGSTFDASVVLYNSGENNEGDLRVTLEIPELGVRKTLSLLKELREGEEYSVYFRLVVPEDTTSGIYTLKARVLNSEVNSYYEEYVEVVGGVQDQPQQVIPTATAVEDTPSIKELEAGKGGIFAVSVGNNGNTPRTFRFEVAGTHEWASSARVDPASITLNPGASAEVMAHIVPYENVLGMQSFTLYVLEGSRIVGSDQLTTNVVSSGLNMGGGLAAAILALVAVIVFFVIGKDYIKPKKAKRVDEIEEIYY
jgi:uncharacterized membrane protein